MSLHQNRHEGEAAVWLKALKFASENVMYLCLMCVSLLFVCMYNFGFVLSCHYKPGSVRRCRIPVQTNTYLSFYLSICVQTCLSMVCCIYGRPRTLAEVNHTKLTILHEFLCYSSRHHPPDEFPCWNNRSKSLNLQSFLCWQLSDLFRMQWSESIPSERNEKSR